MLKTEGSIIALAMDDLNEEGLIGTSNGQIYYANFTEKVLIRLVSKANGDQDAINIVKFNYENPALFLTSGGVNSNTVKLWTSSTVDQVMKFTGSSSSPVSFVLTNP